VDDDLATLTETAALLQRWGAIVTSMGDFNSAQKALDAHSPDCIIADQFLPDGTGLKLIDAASMQGRARILVSGDAEFIDGMRTQRPEVTALLKPVSPLRLRAALAESLRATALAAVRQSETNI
jgi:CheY-like chemotaxis protein